MNLAKFIEVELAYSTIPEPIVFIFPRLRRKDSELDEREKMLGKGRKFKPSERLAELVEDIHGAPDLESRKADESEAEWRNRVARVFGSEDGQEIAEDALLMRLNGVFPRALFRSSASGRVGVDSISS